MNANVFITKDYENETAFRPKKINPNKPNLVRRRRIPKGQNRLPENLATPSKTKGPGKKWILF
jgi:hypothetical protein